MFQSKVEELSSKTEELLIGQWTLRSSSGWIEFEAFEDGALHNIKVHENGSSFEGKGLSDGAVSGERNLE